MAGSNSKNYVIPYDWTDAESRAEAKAARRAQYDRSRVDYPSNNGVNSVRGLPVTENPTIPKQLTLDLFNRVNESSHINDDDLVVLQMNTLETDIVLNSGNVTLECMIVRKGVRKFINITALDNEGNPVGYRDLAIVGQWAVDMKAYGTDPELFTPDMDTPYSGIRDIDPDFTLYVDPEHRGKGIGEALFSKSLQLAGEHGALRYEIDAEQDGTKKIRGSWYTRFNPRREGDVLVFDL